MDNGLIIKYFCAKKNKKKEDPIVVGKSYIEIRDL